MKQILIAAFLLLVVLSKDVELSETSDHDNSTQVESTTSANLLNVNHNSSSNESSLASEIDSNSTQNINATTIESTSLEPMTTTPDPSLMLIPPADVQAQIVKANISTKRPSRIQIA